MKPVTLSVFFAAGLLAVTATGVSANTVVSETADGSLNVVDYSGKPPFKRRNISTEDGSDFDRFEGISGTVLVTTTISRRSGPPGKTLPPQQARIERVAEADISQFARFEEEEALSNSRMWKYAPGKSRPQLGK